MRGFRRLALLSPNNQSLMASSNQDLKMLLAQGKLETALETLVRLTEHADDADLRQRVLTLSGQFSQLKKQQLTGLLDDKDYRLQWNRIAAAVAEIAESEAVTASHRLTSSANWKKWAAILAVLASIAGITGYIVSDFLWPKPQPVPLAEPPKKDTIVVAAPLVNQPSEKPSAAGGKNNVHIEVKDKAKVGNIITGDSNKIDIKQDFGQ